MQECRYTVCQPVQTTTYKTVSEDLLPDGDRDGLPRGVRDGLRAQDRDEAGLPHLNEAVVERYYVPGKTVCINGCLYECPGTWCEKTVCCPRTVDRERLLHGLRIAGRSASRSR